VNAAAPVRGSDSDRPGPKRRAPRRRRRLRSFLLFLTLLVALFLLLLAWARVNATRPTYHQAADRIIAIDSRSGVAGAIDRLSEAGIVRQPMALKIYLRITGQPRLKAGDYKFASPISALQAIAKIQRGEVFLERVTIPEGFNRFEIAETLAAKTGKATKEEFLQLMDDVSLIRAFAPGAKNLEGYLFPDTYNFNSRTTPEDLVRAMVNRFDEVFTSVWAGRAGKLGLTANQGVTLASMIEKEAKAPDDRPLISSVFFNRMNLQMPLASDPTFIYAAILAHDYDGDPNQPRHRHRLSPYNTYINAGLPPGPIASPGRSSLEAALHPASTDYLYFVVSGTNGKHKFSRTAAEHDIAVQDYHRQQRELRQQSGSG